MLATGILPFAGFVSGFEKAVNGLSQGAIEGS